MKKKQREIQKGEYLTKGDYHKDLDKSWKYYPIYMEKMRFVRKYLSKVPKNKKILDVGCGEGILVSEFRKKKFDIIGLDYNYSSKNVMKGDIKKTPFKEKTFDIILALDVIEHLNFSEQELALKELKRILKPGGNLFISIPNLAHFASRISFLFLGKLIRTSTIDRHPGDRTISEYLDLFQKHNFRFIFRKGIFPTLPIISIMTYFAPSKSLWCHRILNNIIPIKNWCFLNIICLKK